MRWLATPLLLAGVLFVLFPAIAPSVSASTPIPGTNLHVVTLGPVSVVAPPGSVANFTWGVFNGDASLYYVNVTAGVDDPSFLIEVYPRNLTVAPGAFQEVRVNATAPGYGGARTGQILVKFTTGGPVVYVIAEMSGGSGAMASFIFGLVLGNQAQFNKLLRMPANLALDSSIKKLHSELTFVVRTFFFVFLGLVFTLQVSGTLGVSTGVPGRALLNATPGLFFVGVALIFLTILGVRWASSLITSSLHYRGPAERLLLWFTMGRGLAAAVLASLPFTIDAFTSPVTPADDYYRSVMAPYKTQFLGAAFLVILLTVGVTTLGVIWSGRILKAGGRPLAGPAADASEAQAVAAVLEKAGTLRRPPKDKG